MFFLFFFFFFYIFFFFFFFFFSSRRRHTRWPRDWSSDVCSSDLETFIFILFVYFYFFFPTFSLKGYMYSFVTWLNCMSQGFGVQIILSEIGRASCRERVYILVLIVSLKKKKVVVS